MLYDMPSVFDSIVRATHQVLGNLSPVVAVDTLLLKNDRILLSSPLPTVYRRIEYIMVALSALLSGSGAKISGELVPVRGTVDANCFLQ